ncbi:MAG: hypothetical protein KDJ26_08075 [Alphaproteobacteria bacterium]|nr:hypothetical protein [Alphaproteobacteria bacterium]MCB9985799.1 hypothetical protein [Micavibrio sp.]
MTLNLRDESGNIIVYVLIGIVLVGLLTAAIRNVGGGKDNIDTEDLILKSGQIQRYAAELARGVSILLEKHVSEADIRFAHPDAAANYGLITNNPENQVFDVDGGRARYLLAPDGVNDGSAWEFFGTSAIPQVGSDKADLIAVLPNVTLEFCNTINLQLGFDAGTMPVDDGVGSPSCIMGGATDRFTGSFDDSSPNPLDDSSFSKLPAYQACVQCASDSSYNYYYVLMAR